MSKALHLLWIGKVGALVTLDRRQTSSGDYAQIYDAMREQAGVRDPVAHASIVELDAHQCLGGVFWDWELAGPDGARYRLHIMPEIPEAAIEACAEHIRRSFDCLQLCRNHLNRMIEFQMPELRHEEVDMYGTESRNA